MASPQRQLSADDLPNDSQRGPEGAAAPQKPPSPRRRRYGYVWVALLLIAAFWFVGFGWGDSGGWIWGHTNVPAAAGNYSGIGGSGVAILEVANKQDYVGQAFQIRNVSVDHWSGPHAVWIGSRHSYLPVLVILASDSALAPAAPGAASSSSAGTESPAASGAPAAVQHLDVTGRIMKAPPTQQAQKQWQLSDDDVNQLEDEGVYIQATTARATKP